MDLNDDEEPVRSYSETTKPLDDQLSRSSRNTSSDANGNLSDDAPGGQKSSSGHEDADDS